VAPVTRPPLLRELKRFASLAPRPQVKPPPERSMPKVAIVGSGPAGLAAAWYLARSGATVTIYESKPVAGGLLAWAIPSFRLPRKALEQDLGYILSLGIELSLKSKVLPSQLHQLRQKNDAVILACGAPLPARLDLPGVDLEGVWLGLDLLYRVALGPEPQPQGPMVVVGGGNVAIDAARWAVRRSGAVTLVCREARQDMPAYTEEVQAAEKEGVKMFCSAQPTAFKAGKDGLLAEVHFEKTLPGGNGPDGSLIFTPVKGEEMVLSAKTCIVAVGQESEGAAWGEALGLGPLKPDQDGGVCPGVYVAGDLATGTDTVVQAMAGGITCARAILGEALG
jgi:NADPH-dependent glutamate synthase beta subunit-like oxidoreductase